MSGPSNKIAARAACYAVERLSQDGSGAWRTKRSNPCPVCQAERWCRVDPEGRIALCMKEVVGGEPFGAGGDHLHVLDPQYFDALASEWKAPERPVRAPKPLPFSANERQRRHEAYQALLDELPSAEEHEQLAPMLAMYPAGVRSLGSRLMPRRGSRQAAAILKALRDSERSFLDVPGFGGRGKTTAAFPVNCEAIAFPTFAPDGLVEGIHLRLLGQGGSKYIWFSGDEFGGVPRDAANNALPVSVYRAEGAADAEFVVVTEGEKKAAAAADAFGCVAISVPGVTQWRAALGALRSIDPAGRHIVRLAWDMDQDENEHVARALESFACALDSERLRVETGRWNPEHKGLDDALIAGGPKLIEWTSRSSAAQAQAEVVESEAADLVIEDEPEERSWWRIDEFQQGARTYFVEDDGSLYEVQPEKKGFQPPPVLISSFVYRVASVIREAGEPESTLRLMIRHQGHELPFEVPSRARAGRNFGEMLAGIMPYYHVSDGRPSGLNLLSALSLRLYKEFPPEEVDRHASGFDKAMKAYRVPGWRIDPEGVHPEPKAVCPVGFGADGDHFPLPDTRGEQMRLAARAYADNWGALLPNKADLTIALAAALAGGAVAALANTSANPFIAFVGQSGSGKTTILKRLQALHGQIDQEPINADSVTIKGAVGLAAKNRHSFSLIDDLKDGRKVHEFVSAAFGGGEQVSMTRERKLRVEQSLRGCFGLTAEDLKGAKQSTINRLITIKFDKRPEHEIEAADAATTNLENVERGNGTSCLAIEAIRRCMAVRDDLTAAFREMQATASRKFSGVSRGKKLAGLIGVAVRVVGGMFLDLEGKLPDWFASPEQCMARVVGRHADAENEYKPATMVAERYNAARATGDELVIEPAQWKKPGSSISSRVEEIVGQRVARDQTRAFQLEKAHGLPKCLAVEPRKFMAALGLDNISEKLAHDSLQSEGMLVDIGWKSAGSPIIGVYRTIERFERGGGRLEPVTDSTRPRLWLIALGDDGEIVAPDDNAGTPGDAFFADDPCEVELVAPPAPDPALNGHRNGCEPAANGRSNGHRPGPEQVFPQKEAAPIRGGQREAEALSGRAWR